MRLSALGRAEVPRNQAFLSIGIVIVLLTVMSFTVMTPGSASGHGGFMSPWFDTLLVVIVWLAALYRLVRYGRRVFSRYDVLFLLTYTLFLTDRMWRNPPAIVSELSGFGGFLMVCMILAPYFEFGKRRNDRSVEDVPHASAD